MGGLARRLARPLARRRDARVRLPARPNVIPLEATPTTCRCGGTILALTTGRHTITLDPVAIHGITERYDASGRVTAYDQLAVYPPHRCTRSALLGSQR